MCRAWIVLACMGALPVGACGDGGLAQAAADGGASSGADDDGGQSTLPPMTGVGTTSMDATMDGGDATDTPADGDPGDTGTSDPGDGSGPGTSSTGDGSDDAGSSGDASTGSVADCADQDAGSAFPLVLQGTTANAGDDFMPGCGVGTGDDVAIRWTAPAAGTYIVHTDGSAFDTVLSVRSDCDGPEIACDDDIANDELDSSLAVELDANESIVIVVDGVNASGTFALEVAWQGYGNCLDHPLPAVCGPDEACFTNGFIGVCGVYNCSDASDCPPPPPDGTAPVVCRDIGGTSTFDDCALDCSNGETCPTGMICLANGFCAW